MSEVLEAPVPEVVETERPSSGMPNPVRMILRHKSLVALAVTGSCLLGAIYYARAAPIYQSNGQVLVVKKSPDALPVATVGEGRLGGTEDYLSTHQTLIRSHAVVGRAVEEANLGGLVSFAGRGNPTEQIIRSMRVSREMNGSNPTTILNISIRASGAQDCTTVVQAVIDSYQHFLRARYKNVTDETAKLITQANDLLEDKLNKKQREYDQFSLEHPTVLWKGKDGLSALQERLASLESKRSALLLQETEIKGRLAAFQSAVKDGRHTRPEGASSDAGGRPSMPDPYCPSPSSIVRQRNGWALNSCRVAPIANSDFFRDCSITGDQIHHLSEPGGGFSGCRRGCRRAALGACPVRDAPPDAPWF
jgi:capsular polysaccharide biosynthesis protein